MGLCCYDRTKYKVKLNIVFEQLSKSSICEICLNDREQSKVFKVIFVIVLYAILFFIIVDNASQVLRK